MIYNHKIRMVVMDIDGTLIGKEKRISGYTKNILADAVKSDIKLVIASGRPFGAVPEELLLLPGMIGCISSNGSSIFRLPGKERIFARDLEENQVHRIMRCYRLIQNLADIPLEVFIVGRAYASSIYVAEPEKFGAKKKEVDYVTSTRIPVKDMEKFVYEHKTHIEGMNFIIADPYIKSKIVKILQDIKNIYTTSSVPRYIEISHGSVCKWHAILYLAKIEEINIEEIAVFGDGENDLEMVANAGFGVAMGNAVDKLKAAADYIAPDCDEDGAAKVIERLIQNNSYSINSFN